MFIYLYYFYLLSPCLLVMYISNRFATKTVAKCRDSIKEREKDLKKEIHQLQEKVEEETEKFD